MTQIILPYEDYFESAMCLHPKHLGNQLYREGMWVLRNTTKTHGVFGTWLDYKYSLCEYLKACYLALLTRSRNYYRHLFEINMVQAGFKDTGRPPIVGNPDFHAAHRSALLRKDKERGWNWYCHMNWDDPLDLPMIYG